MSFRSVVLRWTLALCLVGLPMALGVQPASAAGVVGDGTPASCTEAALDAALAGGGSITFDCGEVYLTIPFSGPKSILLTTTIDGSLSYEGSPSRGRIILSGQDTHRLFNVSNGATLTLRNVILTNGFSSGDGGAIHNGSTGADIPGSVTLERTVIRNSRSSQSGGAIVSTGPLTITNSLLEDNQADNGGALYARFAGARTTIISSVLRSNTATSTTDGWGGAILLSDSAPVSIEGSQIYSNLARQGGGIYIFANSTLTLNGGGLADNSSTNSGGGLFNAGTTTLTGATLSGNSALTGGGLYNKGTTTLTDVSLIGNLAATDGGGLYNEGTATLTGGNLSGNIAMTKGGGLFNSGVVTQTGAIFSNNSALDGGGLFNHGPMAILANVTFSSNSASSSGGGLCSIIGNTTLTNVTLSGNTAVNGDGLFNASSATLTNATLSGNTADSSGGGIYNIGQAELVDVTLSDNEAVGSSGGGLFNFIGWASLANVTLSGNTAGSSGGGIYNTAGSATLANVTLSGNAAGSSGGGLFNSTGSATLESVTLSGNAAGSSGGGIYNTAGYTVTLENSIVAYSPRGGNCGGAALTSNNSDTYSLSSDNTCALDGFGSQNSIDPLLWALGDYGGSTQVHLPKLGSPAIDGAPDGGVYGTDQRGLYRPQGSGYDIGAVERQPNDSDPQPRLYLPLIIRE